MSTTPLPAGSLRATSLNAARRTTDMSTVADPAGVDVLVVGGGVTGAGSALDAAARGLSVALVEAEDFAWTSRWSETFDRFPPPDLRDASEFRLSRISAAERHVLMSRTAPHLVRTLPRIVPLRPDVPRRNEVLLSSGLRAADALRRGTRTPGSLVPAPRRIPAAEALALAPNIRGNGGRSDRIRGDRTRRDELRAGLLAFDGEIDTARLVVALARTAAGFGARVLTRVRARSLDDGGATVVDRNGGEAFRIRARSVINAAGAWAGELAPKPPTRIHRRTQLVIDPEAAGLAETAVSLPRSGNREDFLTLAPEQEGHASLGTAETPVDGPLPDIGGTSEEDRSTVDHMLDSANRALNNPLQRRDVRRVSTELRALVDSGSKVDAKALLRPTRTPPPARGHALRTAGNVVTVAGGTLGTYRRVAADAVDAAVRAKDLAAGPSRTAAVPLVGAVERARAAELDVDPRLVARYGTEAVRVSALAELDADLAEEVAPSLSAAEVVWAVRHEGALNADDVLDRRSRSGLDPERREAARPAVAELVARALRGVLS